MDNPKIENILVPKPSPNTSKPLKNVGVPSSFLEPFADKDFEESVYVRFSRSARSLVGTRGGRGNDRRTRQPILSMTNWFSTTWRWPCAGPAPLSFGERIGTESAIEDVGLDDLCNLAHVRGWFADRDGRIVERAKGLSRMLGRKLPRGGQRALRNRGRTCTPSLSEPGDLSLYYSCCGCMDLRRLARAR